MRLQQIDRAAWRWVARTLGHIGSVMEAAQWAATVMAMSDAEYVAMRRASVSREAPAPFSPGVDGCDCSRCTMLRERAKDGT